MARHQHDTRTLDIEGVDPLPAMKRGTVPERKRVMAYQAPKARPHCATCGHCEISSTQAGYESLVCMLGGFAVQRLSVCGHWHLPEAPN